MYLTSRPAGACLRCLSFIVLSVVMANAGAAQWKKIDVAPGPHQVRDSEGNPREVHPSCSGGPVCLPDPDTGELNCQAADEQFSFYYKPGSNSRLLVYFDGGGACWDDATCILSPQTPFPTYLPQLTERSNPENNGGLFDLDHPDNPYKDWNMVYVPYCTADIHWGSKDAVYVDQTGAVTGMPGSEVTLHHRGFDNFLYVQNWLRARYQGGEPGAPGERTRKKPLRQMLVTGVSAGAYAAVFTYPHLKQVFPDTRVAVMADASTGVVTDLFISRAFSELEAGWGISENLALWVPGFEQFPMTTADTFMNDLFSAVANHYPDDRFAQYNTYWDAIQVLFYNIMLNPDNPLAWADLNETVYADWIGQMITKNAINAAHPNYRYFVGPGCHHTIMRFNDDFYRENPEGVNFVDWLAAITARPNQSEAWENFFCTDCGAPPTPDEVGVCLGRTINQ